MRQWQRWMLAGAISLGLVACGGGGDAESPVPPPPSGGAPQPVLETGRASSVAIGAAGGVLNVTAADGISYQLEIPQGALPGRVQITMTPVSSIGNLPLSGGLVGAVELQPSGLRFARKAVLRIGAAAPSRPELTLTGFGIEAGGARAARSVAIPLGNEVLMLIGHFSTHGAGYGSAADLAAFAEIPWDRTEGEADMWGDIANILFSANIEPIPIVQLAYLTWFDSIIVPMTQRADNDQLLIGAAAEYYDWKFFVRYLTGSAQQAFGDATLPLVEDIIERDNRWAELAGPKFRAAIAANNDLCKAQGSLAALGNVLFLQSTAQPLIDESALQAHFIDRNAVLRELCARMIITAGPTLADPLQSVVPSDLDMTFALKFDDLPEEQAVPVQVVFSGINAAFAKASPANSNVQGEFTLGVGAVDSSEPVTIFFNGCLAIDGQVTDVCIGETLTRNGSASGLFTRGTGNLSARIQGSASPGVFGYPNVSDVDFAVLPSNTASVSLQAATYDLTNGDRYTASGTITITRTMREEAGGVVVLATNGQASVSIERVAGAGNHALHATTGDAWCVTLPSAYDVTAQWNGAYGGDGLAVPIFERRFEDGTTERLMPTAGGEPLRLAAGMWCKEQGGLARSFYGTGVRTVELSGSVTLSPAP
jgi:hypothetical protein